MNYLFLIYIILVPNVLGMFCNYYPLDEIACIQKTKEVSCQFNYFENACVETKSTDLGCLPNLNQQACMQQQRNIEGKEVKCFFRKRCTYANEFHLKFLDCRQNFSIYACVNLKGKNCIWSNNVCIPNDSVIPKGDSCETIFNAPVTSNLCAQIQDLLCQNNGFEGGYFCEQVTEIQLQKYTCDTLGLSKGACVGIQTKGQRCIYKNNVCKEFKIEDEISCLSYLNREACLSIQNPQLLCVWDNKGCQPLQILKNQDCENFKNVNPSVCREMPIYCFYDEINHQCQSPNQNQKQTCNTKGLNKIGCISIKNQKCIYFSEEGCQEVKEDLLNQISCTDSINEEACINVSTPFQYCQWNGNECIRIPLNQDLNCPLPEENGKFYKVNGNVCQAISKQNVGCKYNEQTRLCQSSTGQEICTTPYLNLSGCVQISQALACSWNEEMNKCEVATLIDQVTKCSDLKYSNPQACSRITEFENEKAVGCYFNSQTQQCEKITQENLKQMECLQQGLNKYGCTMITKIGQRCRWFRNRCTSIRNKEQIAQISCLELKYVNPGSCGLVTFQKEVCKYSVDGYGCANSINSSEIGDYCYTLGLNSFACSQITRNIEGCYFDQINNVCLTAPDKKSSDENVQAASRLLLTTAKCVASSPTKNICTSIETLGEQCAWNYRTSQCDYQFVQFNQKCLDYNTIEKQKTIPGIQIAINANVCASIIMNYPNKNPKILNQVDDPLRGYCQFDGKENCIKFLQTPCTTKCCTELVGINAHVCSRFTTGQYCYFNEFNKCVELIDDIVDTSNSQAVKDYYNFKQYKCSSMNKNSCWMIDWSATQQCYWDGLVCTQINFGDYPKLFIFDRRYGMNKFACQGIEGDDNYVMKYFRYNNLNVCIDYPIEITTCETEGINSNVCLRKSFNLYCKWDKINLQCVTIDDYLSLYTCNEYQNHKACIENPYAPCAFLFSTDKCISSPQNINCIDFNILKPYYGEVNQKACQNITKGGQICQYNDVTKRCIERTNQTQQESCDIPGINSIGCYSLTTGFCRWDPINLNCYEEEDDDAIYTLKCSDYVNKKLCLLILNDNCEWSTVDMKCSTVEQLKVVKANTLYNAQACTNIGGAPYYYSTQNNLCEELIPTQNDLKNNKDCTAMIMNKEACLLNTRNHRCIFDPTQIPEKKCSNLKSEQLVCSSTTLINIEICMNIPSQCYFEVVSMTCKQRIIQDTINCSSLIVEGLHYNKLSCSSISNTLNDKSTDDKLQICTSTNVQDKAQQCHFEKYCQWDSVSYGCKLVKTVDGNYNAGGNGQNPSCSLSSNSLTCQNTYSRAACLDFGNGCYFNIEQGGCNKYTENSYKVLDCSQINSKDCTKSKTLVAYCSQKQNETPDNEISPGCSIPPINKDFCEKDSKFQSSSCSSLNSSTIESDCAYASDFCYFDSTCKTPQSIESITCTTPGVSKSLCLQLNLPCDFSSGKCTQLIIPSLNTDKQNYYYVCNEVGLLTTNKREEVCGKISTASCKFQLNSCEQAFYEDCNQLIEVTCTIIACNQCYGFPTAYDYSINKCNKITNLSTDCDNITQKSACQALVQNCQWNDTSNKCHINLKRLNRESCTQLTSEILAIWVESNNQCEIKTQNEIQNASDCSILSRKACLIPTKSCWVNSSTLQCEYVTQIMATCDEINDYQSQSHHCLVSNKEVCKWSVSSSKCVKPELDDSCDVMNKYGCLNMQKNVNCGWSDYYKKCITIQVNLGSGCIYYALGGWQYYNQVNPYVCASLTLGACYLDSKSNKCITANTIALKCNQHKGLNKLACLTKTQDNCKFDSTNLKCIPTTSSEMECTGDQCCLSTLNKVACLSMPNANCQFYLNTCSSFTLKTTVDSASIPLLPSQFISPNICSQYNKNISGAYFIYDRVRQSCLNIDKNSPAKYFALCRSISISEKGCLEKTMEYCQYENDSCQSLAIEVIKKQTGCISTYSWKACIQLNAFCKFQGGRCIPIQQSDTCSNLSDAIVGPQVCSQFPTPCKYDTQKFSCMVVTLRTETCSSLGLSKSACLTYTSTSFCIFDAISYKCNPTYDNTLPCEDNNVPKTWFVNQTKCKYIKASGNYCQFAAGDFSECKAIPESLFTGNCNVPDIDTNPITCRKATNQVCFYNTITQKCTLGDVNIIPWKLGFSFNKLACLTYNNPLFQVKLMWDYDKGCIELESKDLANIQCTSPVNRLACVSITNPTQFCQFQMSTFKCESFNYIIPPSESKSCGSLTNVNRFEFCQYSSESCIYNIISRDCVTTNPTNILNTGDCFDKGMSKLMCQQFSNNCQYNDDRRFCYGGNIFCKDNTPQTCNTVNMEPCWIVNNLCVGISFADLNIIDCEQAVNKIGCTSISNPIKVCQYDIQKSECKEITTLNNPCKSYTNVNTNRACEQTIDTACKFNFSTKSCQEVSLSDVFECDRGLNSQACQNYTRPSLSCKFGKYCYGPTTGISECSHALNKEVCLNFIYQCTWDFQNSLCLNYNLNGQTCQDLQNQQTVVSSRVCYNAQVLDGQACVFDVYTFTCKIIEPQSCFELESEDQCKSSKQLPCIWLNSFCQFFQPLSTDTCATVANLGSKNACLSIFRKGQFCQYQDFNCIPYKESYLADNCLDNINKIACISQQTSSCIWKSIQKDIFINQEQKIPFEEGSCIKFESPNSQDCDKNLSYQACLSITKYGQHCRWIKGECNQIQQSLGTIVLHNTYQLINSNACGLVNQDKVRYQNHTRSCQLIKETEKITCKCGKETKGLNKAACLSIKTESCRWISTQSRCAEFQSQCDMK